MIMATDLSFGRVIGAQLRLPRVVAAGLCLWVAVSGSVHAQDAAKKEGKTELPMKAKRPKTAGEDIPRFAENSPFDADYAPPVVKEGKLLWARSFLWAKPPELVVEKWMTDEPDTKGKYVLLEFWATWCPPCRRTIPLLNELHAKFRDELVVIGVCEETEEDIRRLTEPRIEYPLAIDTQKRTKDAMGVEGIPHIVLLEPDGYVVWEGFPLLQGYELTPALVDKILSVGRAQKKAAE